MKPEEVEERLQDAERVLALHGKRLEKLEEQKIPPQTQVVEEAPDYSSRFEELKALIQRHDLSVQALQIYAQIASFRETISKLPKVLPVRHYHHLEDRSRGFVLGGVVCVLTAAISAGLSFSLHRENSRLRESHVKYRMVRQAYPEAVHWADSAFHQNSEDTKTWLENGETEAVVPLLQQK